MRKISALIIFTILFLSSFSQSAPKLPEVDKSPMDVSYYPGNYPILKIPNKATEPLVARVIYSRPQKQGRKVFGELVEYGKVWRLGANEATEIEFYKDVKIDGKKIGKGRYTLYAVVNESAWTMILNKDTDTWGAFKYDSKKDVMRTDVPVQKTGEMIESMSMWFEKSASGLSLIIAWEQVKISVPITL
ncbi:MAG TPA: DUF2911 domain-containing protein [Chitinophagaceae bacterium]|nr:DUF2911 domain-containing protein [Chitinophagaceae bacterium]